MKAAQPTLNLVASENRQSALTRTCMASRWGEVYYLSNERFSSAEDSPYPIDERWPELLECGNRLLSSLVGAAWVDARPLSGTHVMNCMLAGLTRWGDAVALCPEDIGGHFATFHMAGRLGLKIETQCFNKETYRLDVERCADVINATKPKLVTFDVSHQLFPHPIREIKSLVRAPTIYAADVSHTLGLVVGKAFENPLIQGADILHGGTHKSFPGPQKGLFAGNSPELKDAIDQAIFPQFSSNYHLHHMLALYATAVEMKKYGKEYASKVIANARALGAALASLDIPVVAADQGYTMTHQIWLAVSGECNSRLQQCGIRATTFPLPGTNGQKKGIRLGLQYLTKMGMTEGDMPTVAMLIAGALRGRLNAATQRREVAEFVGNFNIEHFCISSIDELRDAGEIGSLITSLIEDEGLADVFESLGSMARV